jgi:hypothetical protein
MEYDSTAASTDDAPIAGGEGLKPAPSPVDSGDESSVSTHAENDARGNDNHRDEDEDEEEEVTWSVALRPRNMYKLVTTEDRLHIHKLVGVAVLTHYIFRLLSLAFRGTMGFEYETQGRLLFWFGLHLFLSWSSFIFHLPPRRNRVKPMIWPELRLHNIIFATRSILDAVLHIVGLGHVGVLRVALIFITMIAADVVTNHYKKKRLISNTTMRGMPFPKSASKTLIDRVNLYYAMSQLFATSGTLNISRSWRTDVELAFTTLLAVQISALLMTLVRKSVLEPAGWHFIYGISLGLSWVLAGWRYSETSPVWLIFLRTVVGVLCFYVVRFRMDFNKYLLWTCFALVDTLIFAKGYVDFPYTGDRSLFAGQ